jgi:hypothetical protein
VTIVSAHPWTAGEPEGTPSQTLVSVRTDNSLTGVVAIQLVERLGESLVGTSFTTGYVLTVAVQRPEISLQPVSVMAEGPGRFSENCLDHLACVECGEFSTDGEVPGIFFGRRNPGQAVSFEDRSGLFSVN